MIKAPRKKRDNAEERLQIEVSRLLSTAGLLHYHGANEGDMPVQYRVKLKKKGTFAGFPDVMVFEPYVVRVDVPLMKSRGFSIDDLLKGKETVAESRVCCGIAIELKVGKNKPTASQEKWLWDLKDRGWRCVVCYTLDEVLDLLRECYPHKFPK